MVGPTISIDELPLTTANELMRSLAKIGVAVERQPLPTSGYGDAMLVNLAMTLGPGVLFMITAVLLKHRSGSDSNASYKFRRIEKDGSSTEYEMKISARERDSKELSAESLKQLASLTGLTMDQVAQEIARQGS